jgi:hypothetical protein
MMSYQSLPTVNEDEVDEDLHVPAAPVSRMFFSDRRDLTVLTTIHVGGHSLHDRLISWLSILTLVTTTISCGLLLTTSLRPAPAAVAAPRVLRRPSPYVNPELLRAAARKHNATFAPIINDAPSAFQMRAGDRRRALVEDAGRQWTSNIGSIWPEDRHVVVSSNVSRIVFPRRASWCSRICTPQTSTVLQFRNRDFDMERCVLIARLPTKTDTFDPVASVHGGSVVDVWALDGAAELLPSISWGTAPPRTKRMATFVFGSSDDAGWTSDEFHCPSGAFSTFEFECGTGQHECLVDFWQNKDKPTAGGSS